MTTFIRPKLTCFSFTESNYDFLRFQRVNEEIGVNLDLFQYLQTLSDEQISKENINDIKIGYPEDIDSVRSIFVDEKPLIHLPILEEEDLSGGEILAYQLGSYYLCDYTTRMKRANTSNISILNPEGLLSSPKAENKGHIGQSLLFFGRPVKPISISTVEEIVNSIYYKNVQGLQKLGIVEKGQFLGGTFYQYRSSLAEGDYPFEHIICWLNEFEDVEKQEEKGEWYWPLFHFLWICHLIYYYSSVQSYLDKESMEVILNDLMKVMDLLRNIAMDNDNISPFEAIYNEIVYISKYHLSDDCDG